MPYLKGLSDVSRTQVIAKGLNLKSVLKEDFLKEIESKLGKSYDDIVAADIRLVLLSGVKGPAMKESEKGIMIHLTNADFIRFEQPSPEHYRDNVVVITSNRKDNIDKVLK